MVYDWASFRLKIGIHASLEALYNAWTTASGIEKWFLKSCTYKNVAGDVIKTNQMAKQGDTYVWEWYLYDLPEQGKITHANGVDFFQFTFAGECLVDISLKQTDEDVLVELHQHRIPTDENAKFDIRIGCLEGWTFYLTNLKSVYENGYDLRNRKPELKGLNN